MLDQVTCEAPRTIDRYQYGKGIAQLKFKAEPVAALSSLPEAGAFHGIVGAKCGQELRIDFANHLKLRLVCDGEMEGYKGLTIGGYQAQPMEFTLARRSAAKSATFLAAFTLGKDRQPPTLKILNSDADELAAEVAIDEKPYRVTVRPGESKAAITSP